MSKKIDCDRHGGPWGEDETCPRCTNDDGSPRAVPTYTVGVIEFTAVDPDNGGVGGFEWRHTREDLEKALRRLIRDAMVDIDGDVEFIIGLVDVPADLVPNGDFADLRPSERHAITEFIEGQVHRADGVRNRQRFVVLANPSWPGAEMRRVLRLVHGEEGTS